MASLSRKRASPPTATLFLALLLASLLASFAASASATASSSSAASPRQSRETLVLQTTHGRLEIIRDMFGLDGVPSSEQEWSEEGADVLALPPRRGADRGRGN